jgi:hypothetical protein
VKLSFALLAWAVTGCAVGTNIEGDAGPTGPVTKDAGNDAAKKTPPEAGTPPQMDSGSQGGDASVPLTDMTCAGESTKPVCEQCCLKVHPTGYNVYHQALQSCVCTSPGACASECATETCMNQPTTSGDACTTCITASLMQSTGACYNAVATACQGDTDCTALFQTCIPPCETK